MVPPCRIAGTKLPWFQLRSLRATCTSSFKILIYNLIGRKVKIKWKTSPCPQKSTRARSASRSRLRRMTAKFPKQRRVKETQKRQMIARPDTTEEEEGIRTTTCHTKRFGTCSTLRRYPDLKIMSEV